MKHHSGPCRRARPRRWHFAGLLLIVGLLAGLLVTPALAAPRTQGAKTLRIGYIGSPSGDTFNGAQLAIDQINAIGGATTADGQAYEFELVTLAAAPPSADTFATYISDLAAKGLVALLGPDSDELLTPANLQVLANTGLPVLTGATGDTLTDADTADVLFRIRAPERVYSSALAAYMTDELGLSAIALVQADVIWTEAVVAFESALGVVGQTPAAKFQLPPGSDLEQPAQEILSVNPDGVVLWGQPKEATTLLRQLRKGGWQGRFAYRYADEAARADVLPDTLAEGMLGVTSWSYAYTDRATRVFLRDYVVTFGQVPGPLAAAGYDALWYLRAVIIEQGIEPDAIRAGLAGGTPRTLVQGILRPVDFANGDLTRIAVVYELGKWGGPTIVARYDDSQVLPLEDAGQEVAEAPTPVPPTVVPGPPTNTPFPTATLAGTWASVNVDTLNVRTGPGFNYDKVGQVKAGDLLRVLGAISDFSWIVVDYKGATGWIKTEYVTISGDVTTVSIIQAPPTPTVGATFTPTQVPIPDIVIDTVVLSPAQPVPNKPFTATVTVRNAGGGAAGRFAVAATFLPGDAYTATFVEGLAGGQSTQVQLNATINGTGTFQVGIVSDLNNEVAEINESNNVYNITYRADYPTFVQQSNVQLNAWAEWDLYGGVIDLRWDGYNLEMRNGAKIGLLSGITYENATFDSASPGVVTNTTGLTTDVVNPGIVAGFYTAEGQRAILRVDNRQSQTIWISYRVYNNTP